MPDLIVKCPHCGSLTRYGPESCGDCGGELPAKYSSPLKAERDWVCPICGTQGQVYRFRCGGCGRENICLEHRGPSGLCESCQTTGLAPPSGRAVGYRRLSSALFGLGAASLCFGGLVGRFTEGLAAALLFTVAGLALLAACRSAGSR